MTEYVEPRSSYWRDVGDLLAEYRKRLAAIVVVGLLLLYVFSIGPAFRIFGAAAIRSPVYWPFVAIARFPEIGAGEAWYLNAWSRGAHVERSSEDGGFENAVLYICNGTPDIRAPEMRAAGDR